MSSPLERVMTRLRAGLAGATDDDIRAFSSFWEVDCPADLTAMWRRFGSAAGFAGDDGKGEYLELPAPEDLAHGEGMRSIKEFMPKGLAMIGSNGAGEMVVFSSGEGYGLLPYVHGGKGDFLFVARDLEEFFRLSEDGAWFSDAGAESKP